MSLAEYEAFSDDLDAAVDALADVASLANGGGDVGRPSRVFYVSKDPGADGREKGENGRSNGLFAGPKSYHLPALFPVFRRVRATFRRTRSGGSRPGPTGALESLLRVVGSGRPERLRRRRPAGALEGRASFFSSPDPDADLGHEGRAHRLVYPAADLAAQVTDLGGPGRRIRAHTQHALPQRGRVRVVRYAGTDDLAPTSPYLAHIRGGTEPQTGPDFSQEVLKPLWVLTHVGSPSPQRLRIRDRLGPPLRPRPRPRT